MRGALHNKTGGLNRLCIAVLCLFFCIFICLSKTSAQTIRRDISLNSHWLTAENDSDKNAFNGFEKVEYQPKNWIDVNVPHNWDDYGGYRRLKHGNRHGYAWYRKIFTVEKQAGNKRYFLYFEGVGSFATVWLNGKQVGYHAGGRTTFTLDVTSAIKTGALNTLCVRADHPAFIKTLPWVCGGCSDDPGFSEGSQPMGIFRPVHLIVTNPVRVEPFGVHIWNDTTVNERSARLSLETEVKNYSPAAKQIVILNQLIDAAGKVVGQASASRVLQGGKSEVVKNQQISLKGNVHLWSLENPYLYTLVTKILENGKLIDEVKTPYGIRWISWPTGRSNADGRFYLNGKPVFINGIAEYEHLMGKTAAFSDEEIKARVGQVRAAGFNAFRDAHQPHNLRYQGYWDKLGLLWWPQYTAHIWYDTPEFRENFKSLLRDWVKERRNSPSLILWGLQNESRLPEDFARECLAIIREMDPTASSQRKITTCNGGKGTDWDVPQNWTGTYGGNPLAYDQDLKKQLLVGEYGAWRSLDLHTSGPFMQTSTLSEDRMTQLMETKVRLAESVKDQVAGQFQWLLYSHENPGRVQGGEGLRELDRVGPVNYKGLFTAWGQPTDAFYMYRANYAPKTTQPMVYIVSHTWPNRWLKPGIKDSITVYSNCDEVELFNDINGASLGRKKRGTIGTHFQWDGVNIRYNVLYAIGYVNGKAVAHDEIVLNHLPEAPHLKAAQKENDEVLKPTPGYNYLFRYNCGGPDYKDRFGNEWVADRHYTPNSDELYGSRSWTDDYPAMPDFFGSQQRTFDPIAGTTDDALFQTYRYGEDKLKFYFRVPGKEYRIDLFFVEPWYGIGGGMDCTGWRVFDVAVNCEVKLHNLDIFKEAGYNRVLKKSIMARADDQGQIVISFPNVKAGEAIISAIAISQKGKLPMMPPTVDELVTTSDYDRLSQQDWLDIGQQQYIGSKITISNLPPVFYGAKWFKTKLTPKPNPDPIRITLKKEADVYVAIDAAADHRPEWLKGYEVTGLFIENDFNGGFKMPVYRKRFKAGEVVLGENVGKLMYTVVVLPVTKLEPATDLRKTLSYSADNAEIAGAAARDTLNGKRVILLNGDGMASFALTPGVADQYALRVKYYNQTANTFTAKIRLLAADGTLMKAEDLSFKPTSKGKSGTVATTTGTSINAGNYKLVIDVRNSSGLIISGVEMQ